MNTDRRLWVAVLELAIADSLGRSTYNAVDYRRDGGLYDPREEALVWFQEAGDDYRQICDLAGVDPDALRERVLAGRIGRLETTPVRTRRPSQRRGATRTGASPALELAA